MSTFIFNDEMRRQMQTVELTTKSTEIHRENHSYLETVVRAKPHEKDADKTVLNVFPNFLGGYMREEILPIPYDLYKKECRRAKQAGETPSFTEEKIPLLKVAYARGLYDRDPVSENIELDVVKLEKLKSEALISFHEHMDKAGKTNNTILLMGAGKVLDALIEIDERMCDLGFQSDVSYYEELPQLVGPESFAREFKIMDIQGKQASLTAKKINAERAAEFKQVLTPQSPSSKLLSAEK